MYRNLKDQEATEGAFPLYVKEDITDMAMEIAREHSGRIHLLMSDVVIPRMNGKDLAEQVMKILPETKTLFMSGYTANAIAHHGILNEGVHFIEKPFMADGLARKVREVLDKTKS